MAGSNVSAVTNLFPIANEGFNTTLGSTIAAGATVVPLNSVTGLANGTVFVGIIEPGQTKEQVFTGIVDTGGSQITSVKWTRGTNDTHTTGVTIVDYVTGTGFNMLSTGVQKQHKQTGAHAAITADSASVTGAVTAATLNASGSLTVGGALNFPADSVTVTALNLVKSAADANGWVKRDYGNWQTYEMTVAINSLNLPATTQQLIATHSMPVGITDSSLLRFQISWVAGFQGRASFGYDNNTTTAQTTLPLYGYNITGSTVVVSGYIYIYAITI